MDININIKIYKWGIDNYKYSVKNDDTEEVICQNGCNSSISECLDKIKKYLDYKNIN